MVPKWLSGKKSACQCKIRRRHEFDPWIRKITLEKEMAIHSGILGWEIPWREEPGGLQSMGSQRVGHNWVTERASTHLIFTVFCCLFHLRRGSWDLEVLSKCQKITQAQGVWLGWVLMLLWDGFQLCFHANMHAPNHNVILPCHLHAKNTLN